MRFKSKRMWRPTKFLAFKDDFVHALEVRTEPTIRLYPVTCFVHL